MGLLIDVDNRKLINDDDWSVMSREDRLAAVNYWAARGYYAEDPIDGVLSPRFSRGAINTALDTINGAGEPARSNGIPGLFGMGEVSARWGLDRIPWWLWAGLAAGVLLILSSRRDN